MADWSNLGLILCCFFIGIALKRLRAMPADGPMVLNRFIIYVSLPALTLNLLHKLHIGGQVVFPILMPWLLFLGSVPFFIALGRALKWNAHTTGALILTAGMGNTSFLGYPLIETFYGKDALQIGILTDQPGSFLVLSTLGILAASLSAGDRFDPSSALKRIVSFPPFLAAILALALRPVAFPQTLVEILDRLGSTLVPLALVSVGMQLTLNRVHLREEGFRLVCGLFYKLVLGPAVIALLYFKVFGASGKTIEISVFQAAMAPMITGGILAAEHGLNSRLSSLMIGIGIPLSLLTVPAWWWLISR